MDRDRPRRLGPERWRHRQQPSQPSGDPATAGIGAVAASLSTPWPWVWFNVFVTLVCGVILGIVSAKITAAITPKPKAAAEAA